MKETDAVGYPKRQAGDGIVVNGRKAIILENLGLMLLCPCPDTLVIQYEDQTQEQIENDNFETW